MALADQKTKIKINKTSPRGRHLKSPVSVTKTRLSGRHTKSPVNIRKSVPFAGGTPER
jgi:hypothetical protein